MSNCQPLSPKIDISIIVTFYNMEGFVVQNLNSIKCDELIIEIIVVDDCSSDRTREFINNYIESHRNTSINFFAIFNSTNLGVSNSRNIGIEHANGKYLTFLDGDDILPINSLKMRYDALEKTGASLVYGKYRKVDSDLENFSKAIPITKSGSYKALLKSNFIAIGSGMIRKSKVEKVRFRNIGSEDYMFWLEYLKTNEEIVFLDEIVLFYRIVSNSRSGNNSYKKLKLIKEIYSIYLMLGYSSYKSIYYTIRYIILRIVSKRNFKFRIGKSKNEN